MFRQTFLSRTIRALVTDNHSEKFFIVNKRRRATNSIAKANLLSTQEGLTRSRPPVVSKHKFKFDGFVLVNFSMLREFRKMKSLGGQKQKRGRTGFYVSPITEPVYLMLSVDQMGPNGSLSFSWQKVTSVIQNDVKRRSPRRRPAYLIVVFQNFISRYWL